MDFDPKLMLSGTKLAGTIVKNCSDKKVNPVDIMIAGFIMFYSTHKALGLIVPGAPETLELAEYFMRELDKLEENGELNG